MTDVKKRPQKNKTKPAQKEAVRIVKRASRGRVHAQVPAGENVLDLRSIVAQREVERAAQRRQEIEEQTKATIASSRNRTKKHGVVQRRATGGFWSHFRRKQTAVPVSIPTAAQNVRRSSSDMLPLDEGLLASMSQVVKEQKQQAPPTIASWKQADSSTATQEEQKAMDSFEAHSFWERPVDDALTNIESTDQLPRFGFTFRWALKPAIGFALFSLIIILPASVSAMLNGSGSELQTAVTESAETAFQHLLDGGASIQAFDFANAETDFAQSLASFNEAQESVNQVNGVVLALAQYVPGKGTMVESGRALLAAGQELAAAGEQVSQALQLLQGVDVNSVVTGVEGGLPSLLQVVHTALAPTADHAHAATQHLERVTVDALPEDKQALVQQAKEVLPLVAAQLDDATELIDALLAFIGNGESKRYLVLFQNNHELRPTGGFIGSIALVDINNGVVERIDVPSGGVYDIAGQVDANVISPSPLHLVNAHWNLQDANWFPHFPSSAQKVQWFYDRSGTGSVTDGVITLTPSVVEDLLRITGPIDLTADHGVIIDADNFYEEVQVRAEEKFDVTQESKKIITDLTPVLLNRVFNAAAEPEQLIRLLTTLQSALDTKSILVYMNDPEVQEAFSNRRWTGELQSTDRDYLMVVHTNIGGGKTDASMTQHIEQNAAVQSDGSIVNTVTITRVHQGDPLDPLAGVKNVDYLRVYVPQGSELLSADGLYPPDERLFLQPDPKDYPDQDLLDISGEVTHDSERFVDTNIEFEKTVFGGWVQTAVGGRSTVTFQYRLPFTLRVDQLWDQTDHYSLLVQHQPGSVNTTFNSQIQFPSGIHMTRSFPETYDGTVDQVLDRDFFAGMVIGRSK